MDQVDAAILRGEIKAHVRRLGRTIGRIDRVLCDSEESRRHNDDDAWLRENDAKMERLRRRLMEL